MFRPAAIFIGLRYTRAKRRNHFISFISLMSMLGIALGVLVLITVLSVMNGFDNEIKKRVFSMVPAVTVSSVTNAITNWQEAEKMIQASPSVTAVAPFVSGEVMLTNAGFVSPVMLLGIEPSQEQYISQLANKMVAGNLSDLAAGRYNIILGEELADHLNAVVGDKITVITPQVSLSAAGVIPRFKRFRVSGIFYAGSGFGFDNSWSFIHLTDAQKLFIMGTSISGIHVSIQNVYAASNVSEQLAQALGPSARVTDWSEQFGEYFRAVNMEKTMMFFILMLIIAVAVFNLVCTLVMVVNDKKADIAILRTLGATPNMILSIFIVQGAIIGVIGTLLGVAGGVALAHNVTDVVNWIEHVFHVQFISSNIYFVNYLPSEVESPDVWKISIASLVFSLMATLYPAWQASCTDPVEALRYE
jgi:lipoprotein-releasing system permease protein